MQEQLCPLRTLNAYIATTASLCRSDNLFVSHIGHSKSRVLSKQRLPKSIVEIIAHAYMSKGLSVPERTTGHCTWSISTSWVALNGVPLKDIMHCSYLVFTMYHCPFRINVAADHAVSVAVLPTPLQLYDGYVSLRLWVIQCQHHVWHPGGMKSNNSYARN